MAVRSGMGSTTADSVSDLGEDEKRAVRYARVLPLDIVQARGSGHAGTAVGLTPLMTELFAHHLRHDPKDPAWEGRDRFILSCGHTSLSLYLQLYLCGYGLEMDDLMATRELGSITPAHPERGVTPGVEMSTGPLGQGMGSAVGIALEQRRLAQLFEHDAVGAEPFPIGRVWCLVSDGDMFEGISSEAAALAGSTGLTNLIVMWDDNRITIDGPTSIATCENIVGRFAADGWRTLEIDDAESLEEIRHVLDVAGTPDQAGRPTFVRVQTRIGNPMPGIGGTSKAHAGPVGEQEIAATKRVLGLDPNERFVFPDDLLRSTRDHARRRASALHSAWNTAMATWAADNPHGAALHDRLRHGGLPERWQESLPRFSESSISTRAASGKVVQSLSESLPELWGGSCDLSESTSLLFDGDIFTPSSAGRTVRFGIREHAQAAALTGMALDGMTRPVGSTYMVFSDYQRPAVRMAALMGIAPIYVWTHDSLAVGPDGPSHQPVEQLASLRTVPGLSVIRPADAIETAEAWRVVIRRKDGPVGLVLSRQGLPVLTSYEQVIANGVEHGGYVLSDFPSITGGASRVILLATGSEVHIAVSAQDMLAAEGVAARVVSMPCMEWFRAQSQSYRDEVLPPSIRARVSIEAGSTQSWGALVGLDGESIGVEHFGESGDGTAQLAAAGFTPGNLVKVTRRVLDRLGPR